MSKAPLLTIIDYIGTPSSHRWALLFRRLPLELVLSFTGEGVVSGKRLSMGLALLTRQRTMCTNQRPACSQWPISSSFCLGSLWEAELEWELGKCEILQEESTGSSPHHLLQVLQLPAESWLHLALWDFGNLIRLLHNSSFSPVK